LIKENQTHQVPPQQSSQWFQMAILVQQ